MKSSFKWIIVGILLLGVAGLGLAADNTSHTVTVTVSPINEIALTGGNITLTVNAATAGDDPDEAANGTCQLAWTVNTSNKKITVATNQATFNHTLEVVATGVTGGTAAAERTLSTTAQDLVTGITTTLGGCTLDYTASATAAQGTGTVAHTVTFTITS
jgi:hypothetical protein